MPRIFAGIKHSNLKHMVFSPAGIFDISKILLVPKGMWFRTLGTLLLFWEQPFLPIGKRQEAKCMAKSCTTYMQLIYLYISHIYYKYICTFEATLFPCVPHAIAIYPKFIHLTILVKDTKFIGVTFRNLFLWVEFISCLLRSTQHQRAQVKGFHCKLTKIN